MIKASDHSDCPENGKPKNIHGFWSQVHKHWCGKANKTSFRGWLWMVSVADRIGIVKERLSTLTWRLHDDLSSEVFDDGTKELIKNCRVICDLRSLLVKIYQKRSIMVGLEKAKCNEKYHWKCCDYRRRQFDKSLSNVCGSLRNYIY